MPGSFRKIDRYPPESVSDDKKVDCLDCRGNYAMQMYTMHGVLQKEANVRFTGLMTIDCSDLPGKAFYLVPRSEDQLVSRIVL